jgi:metal-responsive CopG/Arc/MetJ family transcriptional regulator
MRTPQPKRKSVAKATPKLHGQRQPLAVTLPPELIVELDAIAAAEERSRAKVVEFACREYVQKHQRRTAA